MLSRLLGFFVIGVLQGVLEWLPVSSEGFLMLTSMFLLNLPPSTALTTAIILHLPSTLAAIVLVRREVASAIRFILKFKGGEAGSKELALFIVLSALLTGLVGVPCYLCLEKLLVGLERTVEESCRVVASLIGFFLIVTGLLMKVRKFGGVRCIKDVRVKDGVLTGVLQGIAVIPGLSRSGLTVAGLLWLGFNGRDSLKLSFLALTPLIPGFILLWYLGGGGVTPYLPVALLSSFISSLILAKTLLMLAEKIRFWAFLMFFGLLLFAGNILTLYFHPAFLR